MPPEPNGAGGELPLQFDGGIPARSTWDPIPRNAKKTPEAEIPSQAGALATVKSLGADATDFYGTSSANTFLRPVEEPGRGDDEASVNLKRNSNLDHSPSKDCHQAAISPLNVSSRIDPAVLPLRHRSDTLLDCYWKFMHPMFPILHKPTFMAKYSQIWSSQGSPAVGVEETVYLSNLNLVLALGCHFLDDVAPVERSAMAEQFYLRSQQVLAYDVLGSSSLIVVQWLLLTAIYCESTMHASRCWNCLGLAVRLSQGLGLHTEYRESAGVSQIDLEMRRRICDP